MFSEKEKSIMRALIEDEMEHIISHGKNRDALLSRYCSSLTTMLSKLEIENSGMLNIEYSNILSQ